MYAPILSVLLLGMIPAMDVSSSVTAVRQIAVLAPSPLSSTAIAHAGVGNVSASGVIILDLQSGQELYAHNTESRRPIGSLTKLMTALLIVENHALTEEVTISRSAAQMEGSSASLQAGRTFTVGDLLSGLLIPSGNDAAEALAVFHSGSEEAFVREMNMRAQELGLADTRFANPAGLDEPDQWSTPRDLGWLALFVLREPAIRERMGLKEVTIRDVDAKGPPITLQHTHVLLRQNPSVVAGKTGTTAAAKQCLLTVVREGGREYVVVLLGARDRYADLTSVLRTLEKLLV